MMNAIKKILFIVIMLGMLVPATIPKALGDLNDPFLKVSVNNVYLAAGAENNIEITLNNVGGYSAFNVESILTPSPATLGIVVIGNAHVTYDEVKEGETKTFYPKIFVDSDVPIGSYTLNLVVKYEDDVGTVEMKTISLLIGVIVNRSIVPLVKVRASEDSLKAGEDNVVDIILENFGGDPFEDVDVTLSSTSPLIIIKDGGRFSYNNISGNSRNTNSAIIAVSRSATPGLYSLTASVTYRDGNGTSYVDNFSMSLNVDSVAVKQTEMILKKVTVRSDEIYPGNSIDLDLELACLGAEASNVKATVSFDVGSPLSTTTATTAALGNMAPGQSATISFGILVEGEAASGSYPIRVTTSYYDSLGILKTTIETVSIVVNGIYDFSLINIEGLKAERGSIVRLVGDLLLIGTESVRFAQINVIGDSAFELTSASSSYIGAIDPDSPIPIDLEVKVSSNASIGTHIVKLNVTYYDSFNKVQEEKVEMPVTVVQATASPPQNNAIENFWIWLRRLFGLSP